MPLIKNDFLFYNQKLNTSQLTQEKFLKLHEKNKIVENF